MKAYIWRALIAWLVHGTLEVIDPGRPHSHLLIAMSVFFVMTIAGASAIDGAKQRSR